MALFSRIEVVLKMKETRIVPVFFNEDIEICKNVVKACYEGGVRVFEFTNRGDFAVQIFSVLNRWAIKECPKMIMGVGSIVDEATAAMYIAHGANFVVSPLVDEATARVCNKRKIAWCPGCGSVSEVGRAHELGAEVIKIFPAAQVGGPNFVKAIRGPMPWTSIMPTGGVELTEKSLKEWFNAGVTCVGIGTNLFDKKLIEDNNYDEIARRVTELLILVHDLKR